MKTEPWEQRRAFLIGLTAAAGTLDALAFLHLGKVFNSFQSGNVLFLGLGAGAGNWGLVVRAGAVIVAFVAGAALGARLVGSRLSPTPPPRLELGILGCEAALLAAFGVLWLALGTPDGHAAGRVVLLALGAGAMGIQAAFALALKIPNVMTVALTATLAFLGVRAGGSPELRDSSLPSNRLLLGLCVTYTACATIIALLPESAAPAFAPVALLGLAVAVDRAGGASASPSRSTHRPGHATS
jgi:uncharacterized membrane protein YoaK (UPF0700 family)